MFNLTVSVDGHSLHPHRLRGDLGLSRLYRIAVEAVATDGPSAADAVGRAVELRVDGAAGQHLTIHGIATEVRREAVPDGGFRYALVVEPAVAALALGRNSRVYQDMTTREIVEDVFERGGVEAGAVQWELGEAYEPRVYTVQYRESDWDFVTRLLAEEGIAYRFDLGDEETTLVIFDDSTTCPAIEGDVAIPHRASVGLLAGGDSVTSVVEATMQTPTGVRLVDYDHEKPRLSLDETSGEGPRMRYDSPGRFSTPAQGKRWARARLDAYQSRGRTLHGQTNSLRLHPGRYFELVEHPLDRLTGELLVKSLHLSMTDGRSGTEGAQSAQLRWSARPRDQKYRPIPRHVERRVDGPQTGIVVGAAGEEIYPDDTGRVRVQPYWDRIGERDDKASTWMRVAQYPLSGSMILPRIGWDVLVHFHEGDIDRPFVSGHLYDGAHPVPYALPANRTRTAWQTATTPGDGTSSEIRFEDQAGSEEIFIQAAGDMNTVIADRRVEKVGVDSTETIGSDRTTDIKANMSEDVQASQTVSVGASESLTVSGGRNVVVGGSETISIGGSRSCTAIGGNSLDAKGGRSLTVGGSMLGVSALSVDRNVLGTMSITVGGAWVMAAATGLDHVTLGAGAETVGGAKICAGGAGVQVGVKGAAAETIGGAYVISAAGNAAETAGGSMAVTVGAAASFTAPSVEVIAKSKIQVRAGGATLTITSSKIEVKAPTIAMPGATTGKKGASIKHN